MSEKTENQIVQILVICAAVVTLIMTPNLNKDALIIPKVIVLFCSALFFAPKLITGIKKLPNNLLLKSLVTIILMWFVDVFLILLNSESPIEQLLFGRTGRGLGIITYFSVMVLTLSSVIFINLHRLQVLIKFIVFTGLISCFYACLQFAGLDPFKWDSKTNGIIGTLGNPNSQSSFAAMLLVPAIIYFWHSRFKWILLPLTITFLIFTIYISQSTQGYFGSIVSLTIFLLIVVWYKKRILFVPLILGSFLLAGFAIYGMLGHGPLSHFLYKNSVQSRGDFWRSAFTTGNSHPLFGVGFDSFGDYYLKYRDLVAASHTFSEYTDSAHNYYLDYLATGGYFFLVLNVLFTLLVIMSFIIIQKNLKSFNKDIVSIFCAWFVFQIQCIINTQSLTLMTWNALISGSAIGIAGTLSKKLTLNPDKASKLSGIRTVNPVSIILLVIGLIIMFPYFNTDRQMIVASKSGNGNLLIKAATSFPESVVKYSQASRALLDSGLPDPALSLARSAVAFNDKSAALWALILINPVAPLEERKVARDVILELDPLNTDLRDFKIQ